MRRTHTGNEGNRNTDGKLLYGLIVQDTIRQQAITVGVAAVKLPATALTDRKSIQIFNNGSFAIYIGDSTVDTSNGYPIYPRASEMIEIEDTIDIWAVSSAAGMDVRIIEGN